MDAITDLKEDVSKAEAAYQTMRSKLERQLLESEDDRAYLQNHANELERLLGVRVLSAFGLHIVPIFHVHIYSISSGIIKSGCHLRKGGLFMLVRSTHLSIPFLGLESCGTFEYHWFISVLAYS